MILIWGSGMYGKCDEVPGVCHVATQFGHLWYIPLIPTGTYAIIEKLDDGGFNGAKIPFSFKSFLLAWTRTALVFSIVACVGAAFVGMSEGADGLWLPIVLAAVLVGAFWGTYKLFGTASYERAKAIGNGLGLNKSGKMLIEVAYGRMSPERLDAEMGEADDEYDDPQEFDDAQADEDEDDEKNPYRDF